MYDILPKSGWNNCLVWATIKEQHHFHVLWLGMHSNVTLRFMVQALQDPPLQYVAVPKKYFSPAFQEKNWPNENDC